VIDERLLFVTELLTLWAVLDPISHLPLFMGATAGLGETGRRKAALVAIPCAFVVLAAFGLGGQYLLHAMGISLLSFQISGGLILLLLALSMVMGEVKPAEERKALPEISAAAEHARAMSVAIYPLAVPIIAGPGSLLSMVVLIDRNRFSLSAQATTLVALATGLAVLLVIFLVGGLVERLIGNVGIQLMRRVMGLIVAAFSVNLILNAVAAWLKLPPL